MMKKLALWQAIKANAEGGARVMLLYVLESSGSSPGRQGFAMMVTEKGVMEGSIGGGIMEHKLVQLAKEKLHSSANNLTDVRRQLHNKSAAKNRSGMICSGEQTVLLYEVQAKDLVAIDTLIDHWQEPCKYVLQLSPQGMKAVADVVETNYEYLYKSDEDWMYKEAVGYQNQLHIIGAGHCALALSSIMSRLDFAIYLYDDRAHLFTMELNEFVHQKIIVDDYSQLASLIPSGKNSYVAVMTFGYRTDDIAVRALLYKQFRYFGVLGSKNKIEKLFAGYKKEGISDALLTKIYAPLGLPIKSESPEEIAISIAAQIIKIKNEAKA